MGSGVASGGNCPDASHIGPHRVEHVLAVAVSTGTVHPVNCSPRDHQVFGEAFEEVGRGLRGAIGIDFVAFLVKRLPVLDIGLAPFHSVFGVGSQLLLKVILRIL